MTIGTHILSEILARFKQNNSGIEITNEGALSQLVLDKKVLSKDLEIASFNRLLSLR